MFIQVMILHEHKTQRLFRNLSSKGNNLNLIKYPLGFAGNSRNSDVIFNLFVLNKSFVNEGIPERFVKEVFSPT